MTKRARAGIAAAVTVLCATAALAATTVPAGAAPADASGRSGLSLLPGNLLVSGSFYSNDPGIVAGQTQLPPGCTTGCVTATANGSYPQVFNNDLTDASFGVTSRIFLSEMTPSGFPLGTLEVPANEMVTSFSSKSELALNLSPDGRTVSFMGYAAKPDDVDVSNSNTPGVVDPTRAPAGQHTLWGYCHVPSGSTMDMSGRFLKKQICLNIVSSIVWRATLRTNAVLFPRLDNLGTPGYAVQC